MIGSKNLSEKLGSVNYWWIGALATPITLYLERNEFLEQTNHLPAIMDYIKFTLVGSGIVIVSVFTTNILFKTLEEKILHLYSSKK